VNYLEQDDQHGYRVAIDFDEVAADTMTDIGVPVRDLEPISRCMLTPGDPSPVGRGEDGDLAYVVLPRDSWVQLTRLQSAELAHIYARAHGIVSMEPPGPRASDWSEAFRLVRTLMGEAAPRVLFEDTNHGEIAWKQTIDAIFDGTYLECAFFQADGRRKDPD
jgi:hypothetical protein